MSDSEQLPAESSLPPATAYDAYAPPALEPADSQSEPLAAVPSRPPGFFGDGTGRLRTAWRFMIFGLGFVITEIAAGIGAAVVVVVYWFATGEFRDAGSFGSEEFIDYLQQLVERSNGMLLCVGALFNAPISLALVMVLRRFLDHRPIWTMGFVKPAQRWSANIAVGLGAGAAPILLSFGVVTALGGFQPTGVQFSSSAVLYIVPLILAAFHEEILFRGYLLQNLLDIRRPIFGVLFTSVLFWLVHGLNPAAWSSPFVAINLLLAGVLLALAYLISDNIWFPTAMHFAWNYFQGPILGIPVSGLTMEGIVKLNVNEATHHYITGGEFGLEGSAICAAVQVAVISVLLQVYRNRQSQTNFESAVIADVV